jgi:chromosome segregation ATPase
MKQQQRITSELNKEFAKGNFQPSKIKKSKSLNDLPTTSPEPINQPRRKSIDLLAQPNSLKTQLQKAHDQISILELKLETCQRELDEKALVEKENSELKNQLTETKSELDKSLEARQQNLKVFGAEHEKRVQAEKELEETVEQSADELINQDQQINTLQSQISQLQQTNQSLQKDLNLTQRLVELRSNEPYSPDNFNPALTYLQYALYALFTVWFCWLLKRRNK